MKQAGIIKEMCEFELTQADVKAICRFRQFSSPQSASPEIVETLITSDVGLKRALDSLSQKELIMLHFLAAQEEPVDISAFARISDQEGDSYGTFTQRYQKVFKDIKKRFIRKGLLAFYINHRLPGNKSKTERTRLCVPVEFQAHLPGMFTRPLTSEQQGMISEDRIRKQLARIGPSTETPSGDNPGFHIDQNGRLMIGENVFSLDALEQWQFRQWQMEAAKDRGVSSFGYSFDCLDALKIIFSSLHPHEWVAPEQLKPALDVFCDFKRQPDIHGICRLGWEMGILKKAAFDTGTCYRLSVFKDAPSGKIPEQRYVTHPENACIDFKKIPLIMLARVAKIARFRGEQEKIHATPDPVMMGRQLNEIKNTPRLLSLVNHLPAFKSLFEQLEKNWGKEILHRNLAVAQIKNIGLKATLEQAFSNGPVLFLPNGFIAFPTEMTAEIEKAVVQQGFAVKQIKPDSPRAKKV